MRAKRILRFLLFAFAGTCLVLFLAGIVLETSPVRRYVLGTITKALRTRGVDFNAASLRYNLFSLSAELDGVVIRSAGTPSLPPIASVQRIVLQARWSALITGNISIRRALIEKPIIHVVQGNAGRSNIPRLSGNGTAGSSLNVVVSDLAVTDGSFTWENLPQDFGVSVPSWQAHAQRAGGSNSYDLLLTSNRTSEVRFQSRHVPISSVHFGGILNGSSLSVNRLQVNSNHTELSVTGSVNHLASPTLDLNTEVQVDVGRWAQILGLQTRLQGQLDAQLAARGPWSQVRIEGPLRSSRLAAGNLGPMTIRSKMLFDLGTKHLHLDPLEAQLLSGTARGQFDIPVTSAAGEGSAKLQYRSLNVLTVTRALDLPVQLASEAAGDLNARWPGLSFRDASWDSRSTLTELQQKPEKGVLPLSGTITAVSQAGRIAIDLSGIDSMGVHSAGHFTISPDQALQGSVQAGIPRLDATMDRLAAYLGMASPLLGTKVEGSGNVTAKLTGTVKSPDLAASISTSALNIGLPPRQIAPLSAEITLRGAALALVAHVPAYGMAATAQLTLRDPYPAVITANLAGTDLGALPRPLPASLAGRISLNLDARGDLLNWRTGTASIRISQFAADWNNLPIRIQDPVQLDYRGEALHVDADLLVKNSPVHLQGRLPLYAGASGNLQVQTQWDLQTLANFLPQAQIVAQGRLTLQGTIQGNLQDLNPALVLTVNSSRIENKHLRSPVTDLVLEAHLRGPIISLDRLSARWAEGRIQASGQAPDTWFMASLPKSLPSREGTASVTASVEGVQLQAINGVPNDVTGTVSLQARAAASKPSLDSLRSTVTVEQLNLNLAGLSFKQATPGMFSLRDGMASITSFALVGPGTRIRLQGTADLRPPRPLNLHVMASSNAEIFSALGTSLNAEGPFEADLSAEGTLANPRLSGFLRTQNVKVGVASPPILADSLDIQIQFANTRATIQKFTGSVNGGPLTATGGFDYGGGQFGNVDVGLQANDVFFQYPQGLDTLFNLNVRLRSDQQLLRLAGKVDVVEGSYQKAVSLEGDLLPYVLNRGGTFTPVNERNALLDRLRFDVGVQTESPIVMDNNLGKLGVTANLQLLGSYYNPGLLGRMSIEQGGQLRLNERTYSIDTGTITFTSPQSIEIVPNIVAKTQASGYDVTLQVTKQAGRIRTQLTSTPPLSQPDIVSVLLTGRTLQQTQGAEMNIAGEQALSYLGGRLGQTFSSHAQRGLGLTTVRLEPSLISAESTPGARLTVGQDITSKLNLSYSINLTNSGDQIWAAQYDLTRRFTTQAVKQSDNSYRFEFRHHISFGALPVPSAGNAGKTGNLFLGNVSFTGMTVFPHERLEDRFGLKAGDSYDFFKVQKGVNRLQKLYFQQDFLSARIRPTRMFQDSKVNLHLHIDSGPKISFAFQGWNVPGSVRKQVRNQWQQGVFDQQRAADAIGAIKTALVRQGYLQSKVTYQAPKSAKKDREEITFRIQPGPRFRNVPVVFQGARQIPSSKLKDLLNDQHLLTDVYLNPSKVTGILSSYYHQHGYLAAQALAPQYKLDPRAGTGTTVIPIREGPRFHVGKIDFTGNLSYSDQEMRKLAGLHAGSLFEPARQQDAENNVRQFYLNHGFPDVIVSSASREHPAAGVVDLTVRITENRQRVIRQVQVTGTHDTSPSLIRKQLVGLQPGDIFDNQKLSQAFSKLYSIGAYSRVDVHTQDLAQTGDIKPNQTPIRLTVDVREVPPWDLSYGGYYDTDRGPGGIVDLANHNMLGGARTIGLRARYDNRLRTGTLYFNQPPLHKYFPQTNLAGYFSRDQHDAFISRKLGFTLQQGVPLRDSYVLTYGYRIERDTTISTAPTSSVLNSQQRIAPLTLSLTRETRNDLLDPTRGMFLSSAVEVGTAVLGSQSRYARTVVQLFKYVPLSQPTSIPFSGGEQRSRWVWASGLRIGLGGGLGGQVLDPSQRFFAGGGTTIRGFGQDEVGPKDANGLPVGGNALFILNQELRFPLLYMFDGAAFVDVGNVYPRISDFNPVRVRSAAGLGLRVHTPYFLLRVDYGIKLNRRPGESFGKLFFSIGQAF